MTNPERPRPDYTSGPWRIRATMLPDGHAVREWWIHDGRLSATPVPGAADLPGAWMLPGGLVDAHVHLTMNFGRRVPEADGSDALVDANAQAHLASGVLAYRDAGCAWGGTPVGREGRPALQRAGRILAPPTRGYPNICRSVDAAGLEAAAMEELDGGAQWVKVLGDFPDHTGNWFAAPANYPVEALAAVVRDAHARGARVMAHSTGLGAADLIRAGVDCIEHGMVLTPDLVREMADRGIAWCLTLTTALKHVGPLMTQQTPVGEYIRGAMNQVRERLELAASLGVTLLAGSDEIGVGGLLDELECLTRYGLSTEQALAAGSTSARQWLGFPEVTAGASADLVLYDRDPRLDLHALRAPSAVVLAGNPCPA